MKNTPVPKTTRYLFLMAIFIASFASVVVSSRSQSTDSPNGYRSVYRVLDIGKSGVPTLRNDQVYWLLTISRNPYWRQRLGSLWFSPQDSYSRPLVVFYNSGADPYRVSDRDNKRWIVGEFCNMGFTLKESLPAVNLYSDTPCLVDPLADGALNRNHRALRDVAPDTVAVDFAGLEPRLEAAASSRPGFPPSLQDLSEDRAVYRVSEIGSATLPALNRDQIDWLAQVMSSAYWTKYVNQIWFSPISHDTDPIVVFRDTDDHPYTCDSGFNLTKTRTPFTRRLPGMPPVRCGVAPISGLSDAALAEQAPSDAERAKTAQVLTYLRAMQPTATPTPVPTPNLEDVRLVYRVVDLGKPGAPKLTNDQIVWLIKIVSDPAYAVKVDRLWFSLDQDMHPLVVFDGGTDPYPANTGYAVIGEQCDIGFNLSKVNDEISVWPQGYNCGNDPFLVHTPYSPYMPSASAGARRPVLVSLLSVLRHLAASRPGSPPSAQDLSEYRPVYPLTAAGMPGVPKLNTDQTKWLRTIAADSYWRTPIAHLWFAPLAGPTRPLIVFYADGGTPNDLVNSYFIVGERCFDGFNLSKTFVPFTLLERGRREHPCLPDPLSPKH
jgi:hypothetical protein